MKTFKPKTIEEIISHYDLADTTDCYNWLADAIRAAEYGDIELVFEARGPLTPKRIELVDIRSIEGAE